MNTSVITGWLCKALWPHPVKLNLSASKNITTHKYSTRFDALYQSNLFESEGWEAEGDILPIATWIEPIIKEIK